MTQTTAPVRIPVNACDLTVDDVIVARLVDGTEARNTVTSAPRTLGGTGLVSFGLAREGRDPWEGRLRRYRTLLVERSARP